jgi:hypothetical protein
MLSVFAAGWLLSRLLLLLLLLVAAALLGDGWPAVAV